MWPCTILRKWRGSPTPGFADDVWNDVVSRFPLIARLDPVEQSRLRQLAATLLSKKAIVPVGGIQLSEQMKVVVAALAGLPILHLDVRWYRGWKSIVIYPGGFIAPRHAVDDAGVHHEWEEVLSGESRDQGPVVLSWSDVRASRRLDGYNVIIHEMAHMLDMLNGEPNGFPPLHGGLDAKVWTRVFTEAYEDLCREAEAGGEMSIDAYATEDPAEFFAVLSEYFFELPDVLARRFPQVYDLLAAFYRQDPLHQVSG